MSRCAHPWIAIQYNPREMQQILKHISRFRQPPRPCNPRCKFLRGLSSRESSSFVWEDPEYRIYKSLRCGDVYTTGMSRYEKVRSATMYIIIHISGHGGPFSYPPLHPLTFVEALDDSYTVAIYKNGNCYKELWIGHKTAKRNKCVLSFVITRSSLWKVNTSDIDYVHDTFGLSTGYRSHTFFHCTFRHQLPTLLSYIHNRVLEFLIFDDVTCVRKHWQHWINTIQQYPINSGGLGSRNFLNNTCAISSHVLESTWNI
jgi:hypothetical protein